MNQQLVNIIAEAIKEDGLDGLGQAILAAFQEDIDEEITVRWQMDVLIANLEERYKLFIQPNEHPAWANAGAVAWSGPDQIAGETPIN